MFKGGYLLSKYSGPGKNGEEISLGSGQGWKENYGRYLIIQMDNGKDVLNFAEVTAFGGVQQGDKIYYSLNDPSPQDASQNKELTTMDGIWNQAREK